MDSAAAPASHSKICSPSVNNSRLLSAQTGEPGAFPPTLVGSPTASPSEPSFCTSRVEVLGEDHRTKARDRPSGEIAGEASPITPSGGVTKVRTLPSASRIMDSVDLLDSSDCEAKAICVPSGVHVSELPLNAGTDT